MNRSIVLVHLSDFVAFENRSEIIFQEFDAGAQLLVALLLVWSYVRSSLLGQLLRRLDNHDVDFLLFILWPHLLSGLLCGSAFIAFLVDPVSLKELLLDSLLLLLLLFQALLGALLSNVAIGKLFCLLELFQLFMFNSLLLLDVGIIFKGAYEAACALEMPIAWAILY